METNDYIIQAVANELKQRQNGSCASCDNQAPVCVVFAPKETVSIESISFDDLSIYCEDCVKNLESEAEEARNAEIKRLETLTEVDADIE